MFSRLMKWVAAAALVTLPVPVLADVSTAPSEPQVVQAECMKHVITGPNTGAKQITFYNRDDQVIESKTGAVNIPVLGCDATYLFVHSPNGSKAKVKRVDVTIDGKCTPVVVSDATAANHSTTGLGLC